MTGQAVLSGAVGRHKERLSSESQAGKQGPSRGVLLYQAAAAWTGAKKSGGFYMMHSVPVAEIDAQECTLSTGRGEIIEKVSIAWQQVIAYRWSRAVASIS